MNQNYPNKKPRTRARSIDGFVQPTSLKKRTIKHAKPISSPIIDKPIMNKQPISNHSERTMHSNQQENVSRPRRSLHTPKKAKPIVDRKLVIRRVIAGFLAVFFLISVTTGGFLGWKFIANAQKALGGSIASNIGSIFDTKRLKGESNGRVNILLAGNSADDPGHAGAQLTDSIMVVSIDTIHHNAVILSIPRDTWVPLPDGEHQKINAANTLANFNKPNYPKGGMGSLSYVVQNSLGIPIDYYALINYTAFRDAVNAVGGITITVASPDKRGLYDPNIGKEDHGPLKLPNGVVTLDGQTALNLARARGDSYYSYGFPQSDFDRTMHQRQMLLALRQKASSAGVVSNPGKISKLLDAVGNNVSSDLNLSDILRLVELTKNIGANNITSATYNYSGTDPLLVGHLTDSGQDALIPKAGIDNFSQLQHYYQTLTSSNPVVKEGAPITILNGTDTSGVATKVKNTLMSKGAFVTGTFDASTNYPTTTIIDNSKGKDPATLAMLKTVFGNNVTTKQLEGNYSTSFVIIVGSNYKAN